MLEPDKPMRGGVRFASGFSPALLLPLFAAPLLGQTGATIALSLDPAAAAPATSVSFNMNVAVPSTGAPAGLQWTLSYASGDVASLSIVPGPSLTAAGKNLVCKTTSSSTMCLAIGMNNNPIASGAIAIFTATLSAGASHSVVPLAFSGPIGVAPDGSALTVQASDGGISLLTSSSPAITSLSPSTVAAGAPAFTLSVFGHGFVPSSVVNWNGSATSTSFVSSTQLQAAIPASAIGQPGTALVFVSNSSTGNSNFFPMQIAGSPGAVEPPSALAVGPAAGKGFTQSMTFSFSDPRGWVDLNVLNVLISNALDARQACYLAYNPSLNVLYLVNDAGTGLLPGLQLNGTGGLVNSQCSVTGEGSGITAVGVSLTMTLNLTFSASFAGSKVVYVAARDMAGNNSGWQPLGTWTVPGNSTNPAVANFSPAEGSGLTTTFVFTFTDTKGYQDLGILDILINGSLDGSRACYLAYSQPAGVLYLVNDPGTALLPAISLNSGVAVTNSQCGATIQSMTAGGNTLTLTLNLTFSAAFTGPRIIYAAARDLSDTHNSGWQSVGTWTVQP